MKSRAILLIIAALLFTTQALAEMKSVRVKTANFREGPSDSEDVLFTADRHYPVKILGRKRGWAKIKDFEGETAWVAERLLARRRAIVVTVERVVVRDKPDVKGKSVFQANWSDAFPVKRESNGWLLIEGAGGKEGWIARDSTWGLE